MKHLKQFLLVLIVAAVCSVQQIFAQQMPTIPIDQNVRIGKLNNGLTYYIRKNSIPANRAFFYRTKGRLYSRAT
jgi:zinc protease